MLKKVKGMKAPSPNDQPKITWDPVRNVKSVAADLAKTNRESRQ